MAFGVTSLGSKGDTNQRSDFTCTLSRAPANNALVLVGVLNSDTAGTPVQPSSVSGAGLVFSLVTSSITFSPIAANQVENLSVWRSMGSGLVNSVITANFPNNTTGCVILVTEVSGLSTSGTSGANAIGKSANSAADAGTSALTIFGPSATSTGNAWFSVVGVNTAAAVDVPNPNWVALDSSSYPTPNTGMFSGWTTLSTGTTVWWNGAGSRDRAGTTVELVLDNPPVPTTLASFVTSSTFTVGNETTSGKILIPSSVLSGHDCYVMVTSKGHSSGADHPTVTDTDSGGNLFVVVNNTGSRKGTLYHKKATSGTAGKLISVAGAIQACAGALSVYSGGFEGDPTTDLTVETNSAAAYSHAAITPSYGSSTVCVAVFGYTGANSVSSMSCTDPGVLGPRLDYSNAAGAGVAHGSSFMSVPATTGSFKWTQSSALGNASMVWAIRPSVLTSMSTSEPTSTVSVPIHTYLNAGTYVVKLTVTDNDGNSSSTTKAVTVS
jgi:hypothetical protein